MREIDHDGLMLCNIQGEMFRKSAERASCTRQAFLPNQARPNPSSGNLRRNTAKVHTEQ